MRRNFLTLFVTTLATGTACNSQGGEPSGSDTDTTGAMTDGTTGGTTSGGTTTAATEAATSAPTTSTTGEAVNYCHGFQVGAEAPFLSLYVLGGEELVDGMLWPIECGGQGLWMFGLYPSFGGWDPMTDGVTMSVEVDVADHNDNPDGHFFSGDVGYYIGCEDVLGGVLGVAPVLPPDELADLSVLDGLPAQVRVTVLADGVELVVEATVTLSAPSDLVAMGCGFG
jgi:hypothetical protein